MFDNNGNLIIPTLEENQVKYQKAYLDTFGLVDIEPSSALGSDLAITAEMKKISDEFTQHAFLQNSPFEATGRGLDNLCFLRGIRRKENEHSIALVIFYGADGIIIPKNAEVKNILTDEKFMTHEQGIIENGTFSVLATALNSGRVICNTGTLAESNVEDVTVSNPDDGFLGFDIESDTELRDRLLKYQNSLNIDENLYLKLKNLLNVKYVNIVSNPELVPDFNGISPRSTAIIVLGGNTKEIGEIIFSSVPADKKTIGDETVFIVSKVTKREYIVKFSRPEIFPVFIEIKIDVNNAFKSGDVGIIRESILSFFYNKFSIGDSILIDSLYIPIQQDYNNNNFCIEGISNIGIKINDQTKNIPVAYNQYVTLSSNNLTIIVS